MPAVSPSKRAVLGGMNQGFSPPVCRTPIQRSSPYRRCGTGSAMPGGCEGAERLPPSPSDPQLSIDLRKTALLRSMLLRTEVYTQPLSTVCLHAPKPSCNRSGRDSSRIRSRHTAHTHVGCAFCSARQ